MLDYRLDHTLVKLGFQLLLVLHLLHMLTPGSIDTEKHGVLHFELEIKRQHFVYLSLFVGSVEVF